MQESAIHLIELCPKAQKRITRRKLKRKCAAPSDPIDQGRCLYCDRTFPLNEITLDHLVAKSRGGLSVPENLWPSCKPCNGRKGSENWAYWLLNEQPLDLVNFVRVWRVLRKEP